MNTQIQEMQEKLCKMLDGSPINTKELLTISQQLDRLIVEYYKTSCADAS